ncbi:galacturonan 1,4-alpha-galacturonidase [Sarracenia purpurea var. burkii]
MALIASIEIKGLLILGLTLLSSWGAHAARRGLTDGGATVFDVTQYGAKPNGKTESAQAFIRAWNDACKSNAAATLLIPEGTFLASEVFFHGPCSCSSPITVEVRGTVLANTDLSVYPDGVWFTIGSVNGLVMTGGGTFDGQGKNAWGYDNCGKRADCNSLLPPSIIFASVNNSLVRGINMVNSMGYHIKIRESFNFTVQEVNITAPEESPNTDGIHTSRSDLITITDVNIGTGDDCISIGEGSTNVNITRVTCGPGHGISVGSLGKRPGEMDVKGITITNCTLTKTTNGARIKTWQNPLASKASNIIYQDIIMDQVRNPIFIDQHYGSKRKPGSSRVKISDVRFSNIRGTTTSINAVALSCSEAVPCEGVELADIDLAYSAPIPTKLTCSYEHAAATFSGKQNPPCNVASDQQNLVQLQVQLQNDY